MADKLSSVKLSHKYGASHFSVVTLLLIDFVRISLHVKKAASVILRAPYGTEIHGKVKKLIAQMAVCEQGGFAKTFR